LKITASFDTYAYAFGRVAAWGGSVVFIKEMEKTGEGGVSADQSGSADFSNSVILLKDLVVA
jgi:hypothetical protein